MPHPQSPHRPPSVELSGGLGTIRPSKDTFCTPIPLHPQVPLPSPSPRPSAITSAMATAFPEPAPSKGPRPSAFMTLNDSTAMQWAPHNDFPVDPAGQDGFDYDLPLHFAQQSVGLYDYTQNGVPYNHNYNLTYSAPYLGPSCPRSYTNDLDLTGLPMNIPESYPPAAYQIEPQTPQEAMDLSDQGINGQLRQLREDYDNQYPSNIKQEDLTGYNSPYDSDITRSSTPSGDPPMPPHGYKNDGAGEEGAIDKEQPYAQLIYRALKEAPGHTMILRDIYDWFKKNTEKAADKETKGWQNSIRHNLSMNGVRLPCAYSLYSANCDRPSRKLITYAKNRRKASCGDSPRKPSARASSQLPATGASSPTSAAIARKIRFHNGRHQARKEAKLHDGPRGCEGRIA